MKSLLNRFRASFVTPVLLAIWAGVSVTAGITGPFGTFQKMGLGERSIYWAVMVAVSILVGRSVRMTVERVAVGVQPWVRDFLTIALVVPMLTVVMSLLIPLMPGVPEGELPEPQVLGWYVLLVSCVVMLFRRAVRVAPEVAPVAVRAEIEPRLAERLPDHLRGPVLRLSGRDHFVEVVTLRGRTSLRMRLADAIREMDSVPGHCTHRSHWVSCRAVAGVERGPGAKLALQLINGETVPVSRKYRSELEGSAPDLGSGPITLLADL